MRVFLDKCILMHRRPRLDGWVAFDEAAQAQVLLDNTTLWKLQGQAEVRGTQVGMVKACWAAARLYRHDLMRQTPAWFRRRFRRSPDERLLMDARCLTEMLHLVEQLDRWEFVADINTTMSQCYALMPEFDVPIREARTYYQTDIRRYMAGGFLREFCNPESAWFHCDFAALAKEATSSQRPQEIRKLNDLWDAWGLHLAKLNECNHFMTVDYKLQNKFQNTRLLPCGFIVTPMQLHQVMIQQVWQEHGLRGARQMIDGIRRRWYE